MLSLTAKTYAGSIVSSETAENDVSHEVETLLAEVAALANRLKQASWFGDSKGQLLAGAANVLQILARSGSQTVPQIARARATSRQNIQVVVNRLVTVGYVEAVQNPAHKRSML